MLSFVHCNNKMPTTTRSYFIVHFKTCYWTHQELWVCTYHSGNISDTALVMQQRSSHSPRACTRTSTYKYELFYLLPVFVFWFLEHLRLHLHCVFVHLSVFNKNGRSSLVEKILFLLTIGNHSLVKECPCAEHFNFTILPNREWALFKIFFITWKNTCTLKLTAKLLAEQ